MTTPTPSHHRRPPPHSTTHLYTTTSLALQPTLLTALTSHINTGFEEHHFPLIPRTSKRLDSDTQILSELGEHGLMLIRFFSNSIETEREESTRLIDCEDDSKKRRKQSSEEKEEPRAEQGQPKKIMACAGLKPWNPHHAFSNSTNTNNDDNDIPNQNNASSQLHEPHTLLADASNLIAQAQRTVSHSPKPQPNNNNKPTTVVATIAEWEVTLVTISPDPALKGVGIGVELLARLDREILEMIGIRPIRIMARTLRELNEEYWIRRGYRTVWERRMPVGTWESEVEFGLLEMERWIC